MDLFNSFDTEKTGKIKAEKLYEIASILGKDGRNGIIKPLALLTIE